MKAYIQDGESRRNAFHPLCLSNSGELNAGLEAVEDGMQLKNDEVGNFEWWCFDVIDPEPLNILKIVVHLGTDPLRRRFFPQLAVSVKTPSGKNAFTKPYAMKHFHASSEKCDLQIKKDVRISIGSSGQPVDYKIKINLLDFYADLTFSPDLAGWKPLGDELIIDKGDRRGIFCWIIPVPKARVSGQFCIGKDAHSITNAIGYHDHNCWIVDPDNKLYVDEAVSGWIWGRFLGKAHTAVFMETCIRKNRINSLMIAKRDKIVHSAHNAIRVKISEVFKDKKIKTTYPVKMTIEHAESTDGPELTLTAVHVLEKKDLLEDVHPLLRRLIKLLISRPCYYGVFADGYMKSEQGDEKGLAIYEHMLFRGRNLYHQVKGDRHGRCKNYRS